MAKSGVWTVTALLVLLPLTACGSNGDDGGTGGVASANGGNGTSEDAGGSDGKLSDKELHERLLKYAKCLRDNGLDVKDPAPGEGIQVENKGDPHQADAALKACEDVAPPAQSKGDEAAEREGMLAYAKCMRDNGVEKFADPKQGEGVDIGPEVAQDPDFKQAEEECEDVAGADKPRSESGGE
jgi:hypothetical protein